jgi:hypothetical protein
MFPFRRVWSAFAAALLCTGATAAAQNADDRGSFEPAIPPGQEHLLIDMLGTGAALPGDCELASGVADFITIKATYTCAAGDVVIHLVHPDKAPAAAVKTERFALSVHSGSPPPKLTETVATFVRAREGDFEWTSPAYYGAPEDAAGDER